MIHAYLVIYSGFFVYLSYAMPNVEQFMNRLEHCNEVCVIGLHYTMLFLVYGTEVSPSVQWGVGNVAMSIVSIVFLANMIYLVCSTARRILKWSRLKKLKRSNLRKSRLKRARQIQQTELDLAVIE